MSKISLTQESRRGVLKFKFAPGLGIYPRLLLFVLLFTAGSSIMFRYHWAAGAPVFFLALWSIMARGVSNSRTSEDTKKDRWVIGTSKDLRKIERKVKQGRELPSNALSIFSGWGILTFLGISAALAYIDYYFLIYWMLDDYFFTLLFIEVATLLTIFITASAFNWEPSNIIKKKDYFVREGDLILEKWKDLKPVVRPMLLLDEGDAEMVTPEDIKLFVTFEEAPKDFIGVQAQITYNMGQPYLYCVVLAQQDFAPMKKYKPKSVSKITFEKGSDGKVAYVVVRQTTTRESGYTTSLKESDHVVETAMQVALELITS